MTRKTLVAAVLAAAVLTASGCVRKKEEPPEMPLKSLEAAKELTRHSMDDIRTHLAAIRERLKNRKFTRKEHFATRTEMLEAVNKLLDLSGTAREDVDAILRHTEDIKRNLVGGQIGYRALAERARASAGGLKDADMKAIALRTADEHDQVADDFPRLAMLVDNFHAAARKVREQLAESVDLLRVQRDALEADLGGPTVPKFTLDAKTYLRQFEQFITIIEQFQRDFNAPPRRTTSAAPETPVERDPFKGTEEK